MHGFVYKVELESHYHEADIVIMKATLTRSATKAAGVSNKRLQMRYQHPDTQMQTCFVDLVHMYRYGSSTNP